MTGARGLAEDTPAWRSAHLAVSQTRASTERHELSGDLLILTSSWERRCTEIARARHGQYRMAAVVRFAEEGISGRRAVHDDALDALATVHADDTFNLERMPTAAVDGWRDALVELVSKARAAAGRPIDVVADVSCLPKYYMLVLIGFCLSSGAVRSLRLLYAEGRYAPLDSNASLAPDHAFTEGAWRSLQVPFLEGRWSPDKKVEIVASIGFETFEARKLIRLYEAERHRLITPHPGFSVEYGEQSEREAKSLAHYLDLDEQDILRCPAGDATSVAARVIDILDSGGRFKEVGLCMGTKPHAIGLGLASLVRSDFTLVCRMPDRYVETETPATGQTWSYELRDLSATTPMQEAFANI